MHELFFYINVCVLLYSEFHLYCLPTIVDSSVREETRVPITHTHLQHLLPDK